MAERVVLILFGVLLGVVCGITLMSLVVVSTSLNNQKSLGDVSNLVIAVGALFTLGFSLWQHQQTLNRERSQSQPRLRLVGAPINKSIPARADMEHVEVEFQFINDSKNPASNLHFRIFMGPISQPDLLVVCKDEIMANPTFGGQGFHWVLKGGFAKSISPKENEVFVYLRLDYLDTNEDGESLVSEYFLKINHSEAAIANATKQDVAPFKAKIAQLLRL